MSKVLVFFCIQPYYNLSLVIIASISFIFLHLLSANHKCTHPCYFPYYSKPAAQMLEKKWNSSMRSSRLALPRLHFLWIWSLPLFCFHASRLVFCKTIFV
jgi:hypothetical protein